MIFSAGSMYFQKFYRDGAPGDADMVIDASGGPVYFLAPIEDKLRGFRIINLTLSFQGGKLNDPENFSGLAAPLANGIEIGLYNRAKSSYTPITEIVHNNRDLNVFAPASAIVNYDTATKDIFSARFFADFDVSISTREFGGLYILIRDDCSDLDWMEALIRGVYTN